jgi:hypothetical protein
VLHTHWLPLVAPVAKFIVAQYMHCPEEVYIPLLLSQVPPQLRVIEFHVPFRHPHPFAVAVDVVPVTLGQYMQVAIGPPT